MFRDGAIWGVHTSLGKYTFAVGIFDEIRDFILRAMSVLPGGQDPFVMRL